MIGPKRPAVSYFVLLSVCWACGPRFIFYNARVPTLISEQSVLQLQFYTGNTSKLVFSLQTSNRRVLERDADLRTETEIQVENFEIPVYTPGVLVGHDSSWRSLKLDIGSGCILTFQLDSTVGPPQNGGQYYLKEVNGVRFVNGALVEIDGVRYKIRENGTPIWLLLKADAVRKIEERTRRARGRRVGGTEALKPATHLQIRPE